MDIADKKVYIETLGCQMNKSDTERILGILSHFGYCPCKDENEADLCIVNTCSIRQLSEDKAYSKLGVWGKMKKEKPLKVGICGCVAQQEKEKLLKRFPYVDLVFGTQNIYELPELIQKEGRVCAVREKPVGEADFNIIRAQNLNAWLPIIEGCNNFCSYCVVPYTRGRERSREVEIILNEARNILKQGFREITLLGQNVDSYGKDLPDKPSLAYLLRELDALEGEFRIRFTTSYPTDITDELIETVKNASKICECFHIPMQSGSDRILKAMNRRYDRNRYAQIVKKIRDNIKNVTITSDFIAGFPGETDEDFEMTLSAFDEFELDYSNTAAYSPRPNTPAAKMTDKFLDEDEKKRRLAILNEKVKEMSLRSNQKYLDCELEVLVESFKNGKFEGRTRNNKVVHLTGEDISTGDFVNVKITKASTWCLFGEKTN